MYLRWSNAEQLMIDALASVATWPRVPDLGDLRSELQTLVQSFSSDDAWATIQLTMRFAGEASKHPRLFQAYQERSIIVGLENVTAVFGRAIARHELPAGADPAALALAFAGALTIAQQLAQTPGHGLPTSPGQIVDSFIALRPDS